MNEAQALEQRRNALTSANRIRTKRAAAKKAWSGTARSVVRESIASLVAEPPDWAATWKLKTVLTQVPSWGPSTVVEYLEALEISTDAKLEQLSPKERLAVVELLIPSVVAVRGFERSPK